jgi:hypothetical protein
MLHGSAEHDDALKSTTEYDMYDELIMSTPQKRSDHFSNTRPRPVD